jgi:hypothetical protein
MEPLFYAAAFFAGCSSMRLFGAVRQSMTLAYQSSMINLRTWICIMRRVIDGPAMPQVSDKRVVI